jgi:hypothetical protein
MITFILLGVFFMLAVFFGFIAYTSNNRKRAGKSGVAAKGTNDPKQARATPASN